MTNSLLWYVDCEFDRLLSLSFSLLFLSFSFSSTLGGLFLIRNRFSGMGGISSGRTVDNGCASVFSSSLSLDELFLLFFLFFFSFLCFFEFLLCFFFRFLDFSSEALSESDDESEDDSESLELSESLDEEDDLCLFFSSFLALDFGINSPQLSMRTSAYGLLDASVFWFSISLTTS